MSYFVSRLFFCLANNLRKFRLLFCVSVAMSVLVLVLNHTQGGNNDSDSGAGQEDRTYLRTYQSDTIRENNQGKIAAQVATGQDQNEGKSFEAHIRNKRVLFKEEEEKEEDNRGRHQPQEGSGQSATRANEVSRATKGTRMRS